MVNQLRKAMLVVLAVAAVLTACAPAQGSTDANQGQVATSVAMTVQAQVGGIAAAVVSTLTAQAPAATATLAPTQIPLNLPVTDTPLATVTPFVVTPASGSGGGGSGATTALYACSWYEVRPTINVFKPGDSFAVKWVVTNTGTKDWVAGKDFKFASGTQMSSFTGVQLPAIKSGDTFNINFSATAPTKPGFYEMQFKVEGGLCFPALDIEVGKPKDP